MKFQIAQKEVKLVGVKWWGNKGGGYYDWVQLGLDEPWNLISVGRTLGAWARAWRSGGR